MRMIQEATNFSSGKNLVPVSSPYQLPDQKDNVAVFLLSGSFEYDIELIKRIPPPRTNFKNIIIPHVVNGKLGVVDLHFKLSDAIYKKDIEYVKNQKMVQQLKILPPPIKRTSRENIYVPLSDVVKAMNPSIRGLSSEYLMKNAPAILGLLCKQFSSAQKNVILIDADRYRIYNGDDENSMKSDLVNAVIGAYLSNPIAPKIGNDVTMIFRATGKDYKMDLRTMDSTDVPKLEEMCTSIGRKFNGIASSTSTSDSNDLDVVMDEINADASEESNGDETLSASGGSGLKQSLQSLKDHFGLGNNPMAQKDSLYSAKTLQINASLIHKINPSNNSVSDYKRIAADLTQGGDTPVEDEIIDQAAKDLADSREATDEDSVMKTITTPREMSLRENISQIRLKSLDVNAIQSVTDVPKPKPIHPIHLTTTNPGALSGTSFTHVQEEYEKTLLDQDIIASFMTLKKLPEGFEVTGIDVDDISTPLSLMHNWRVHLKNKSTGTTSSINIRIPKMMNGRFYYNGVWRIIGKQDYSIPILKLNSKRVMLTSNYNKIDVLRYDTKSLVDITMMLKAFASKNTPEGTNPFVKYGSSTATNTRFVSTIEFDEYAKRIVIFENKERECRILFNRENCLKEFGFVTVQQNEFCCGMINQVPIVLNTETGLTRDGKTLTEIIYSMLPDDMIQIYNKAKPTKLSMYAYIIILSISIPLGVAIAAWEGLPSLLKRSNADYKYISPREDAPGYIKIPFKDKTLAVKNTIQNQLLFNGFYRLNPRQYTTTDFNSTIFEDNSVFVDIFNQLFFKQYSQLTTFRMFYHFFVDAVTESVCQHYKLPNNICDMLLYATNMLADNHFTSENDAKFHRIRGSEIIPAIIHTHLAQAIARYNNQVGSKTRDAKLPWNAMEVMNELLEVPTVSPSSSLNPVVELHLQESITQKGYHGVNDDHAYSLPRRSFEDSMVGKMAMSSPNSGNIGINRQLVADPKMDSVRGYTNGKSIDDDFNDMQLASFSELLTPGTISRDDAIRTAIATSQSSHILPTNDAEPVLISNGVDEVVPAYLSEEFSVMAKEDGKVLEITDGYMIVEYKSGRKQAIPVASRYAFNSSSGFYTNNKLIANFQPKDIFKQNDILAYHEKFFTKDSTGMVRMNLGPVAKVAFAGLYSTYEDAGLITHKMSKRMSSTVTMCQATKLDYTDDIESVVKVGDEVEIGTPLIVFGMGDTGDRAVDNFLRAFGNPSEVLDSARRTIKSKHAGRVVDVRMYTRRSMDKLSPSLFELLNEHFKENIQKRKILDKYDGANESVYKLDTLYTLPTQPIPGPSLKGINCDVLIEVYIEHDDEVSIGDKCVVYAASKQVISEVIPEGLEPYTESRPDEEVSMFVAPGAIMKRMIPSVMIIGAANKVLIELKRKVEDIWKGL